jgi:chloramphenicol-sensitive protein RarD
VLFLPALAYLLVLGARGDGQFGPAGVGPSLLLAAAGVATAVPLLFFASAARRVPLSTLGLLQYLTPVLQLLTGVLVYDEPMPPSRVAGFALVWAALVLLSFDGLRHGRSVRRDRRTERPGGDPRDPAEVAPAGA